ncbi:MAG: hypothetical protein JSW05_09880 [Candidatus Thorarchaeota archaeon]|nr:MAG: hypothetical protein JSW05_09880 [Candidatus Thorarchaeota archaeon]
MIFRESSEEARGRFRTLFLNETRPCIFREDVPEISVGGKKIGPYKAGVTEDLPNWAIEILMTHGLADLDSNEAYELLAKAQDYYERQRRNPHILKEFPNALYSGLSRRLQLIQRDKTSLDPEIRDEIKHRQRFVQKLIQMRLTSIIQVARSGADQDKRERMSQEERWLCDELEMLLSSWREIVTE